MNIQIFLVGLLTILAGVLGAKTSLDSYNGESVFPVIIAGVLAIVTWAFFTKLDIKPWKASLMFDGLYGLSWLVTLTVLGEKPTTQNILAAVLVIGGLAVCEIELN